MSVAVLTPPLLSKAEKVVKLIRSREWWDSKIPLALASVYALAWREKISLRDLWYPLLLLVSAGIASAIFASVFNDLLDQKEDCLAGKDTVVMSFSKAGKWLTLILIELAMLGQTLLLLPYRYAFYCFIGIWILYTAYSLPPIRLKERGGLGVLCIAAGEHLLASLLGVALILEPSGKPIPIFWTAVLFVWCLTLGCRSILWHQLTDYENDRKTKTKTMSAKYDFETLRRLGERYLFPIEIASFLTLLTLSWNPLAWQLLGFYLILEWLRYRYMGTNIVIVAPEPNPRFAVFEYYQLFFPLAYLIPNIREGLWGMGYFALQLLLFPSSAWICLTHIGHLLRWQLLPFLAERVEPPAPDLEAEQQEKDYAARMKQIDRTISPKDVMYGTKPEHYYRWGNGAVYRIQKTLANSGKDAPRSLLNLPCGHGRELRFMKVAFPEAHIVACDLDPEAVDFCVAAFGVKGVYSRLTPSEIPITETFDVIWVGSLFTHLDQQVWREFLTFFSRRLKPGGVLLFTSHGPFIANELRTSKTIHHEDPAAVQKILDGYDWQGFGYARYTDQETYGLSCASPAWVRRLLLEYPTLRLAEYVERGWYDYQDTVAVIRLAPDTPLS